MTKNDSPERNLEPGRRAWGLASVLLVLGAWSGVLGLQLAALGGSLYYALLGAMLIACAVLLWRRSGWGAWAYGFVLVATAIWSVWERGFDAWALAARLGFLCVLALWFPMPWVRRGLVTPGSSKRLDGAAATGLLACALLLLTLGALLVRKTPLVQGTPTPAPIAGGQSGLDGTAPSADWPFYGNSQGGTRFSPLRQINRQNISQLKVAWIAHLGASSTGEFKSLEVVPLKVDDTLYACNGVDDVSAIDAETGAQRWHYRAGVNTVEVYHSVCRGVSYYRVPEATGECAARIYTATMDARLIALDSRTGRPCSDFGKGGVVDLLEGMGEVKKGYYSVSSAPQVVRGKLVVGGAVLDNQSVNEPSGVIRAFDAVTGQLAWAWDIDRPGMHQLPPPGEFYSRNTPNSWAPMSADDTLGLVFVPTGNATPDAYSLHRSAEARKYSSALVALDADTGEVRWSFQTTHQDLWDYDVASQPTLLDFPTPTGLTPAVVQPTKRGELFVLDRRTGVPLVETREIPAPQHGAVPEERPAATQPVPVGMPSFRGADLTEQDMWGISPMDQALCRIKFRQARYDGPLTLPGLTSSIQSPGYAGGMDWGGTAVDPERHLLIFTVNHFANYNRLITRAEADAIHLTPATLASLARPGGYSAQAGTPYAVLLSTFSSPLWVPCQGPPYGTLNAVDLVTRKLIWSEPLGTARDVGPFGWSSHLPFRLGTPTTGGSLVTGAGLTFIGASLDRYFRAFDSLTGELLWEVSLPASALSSPMSYISPKSGRQFVVVAAGGSMGIPGPVGDDLVAYTLPARGD